MKYSCLMKKMLNINILENNNIIMGVLNEKRCNIYIIIIKSSFIIIITYTLLMLVTINARDE